MPLDRLQIEGKIESFSKAYKDKTGQDLDKSKVKEYLEKHRQEQNDKLIGSAFSDLSYQETMMALDVLDQLNPPQDYGAPECTTGTVFLSSDGVKQIAPDGEIKQLSQPIVTKKRGKK